MTKTLPDRSQSHCPLSTDHQWLHPRLRLKVFAKAEEFPSSCSYDIAFLRILKKSGLGCRWHRGLKRKQILTMSTIWDKYITKGIAMLQKNNPTYLLSRIQHMVATHTLIHCKHKRAWLLCTMRTTAGKSCWAETNFGGRNITFTHEPCVNSGTMYMF